MPEIRKDPILGHSIIVAEARQKRPNDFAQKKQFSNACPFCSGNENLTPPEIYRLAPDNGTDNAAWELRVVPNKFPALDGDAPLLPQSDGIYSKTSAPGRHEVLIETPLHSGRLEKLPIRHLADIIRTCAMRSSEMLKIPFIKYVMVFKNQGRAAGASLEHPHTQIAGIPLPPKRVIEEIRSCKTYKDKHGKCLFCDIIRQEENSRSRIISENTDFISFAPFASRTPFEINIFPKGHLSFFEEITDIQSESLAEILQECLCRLSKAVPDLCYNMMFLTSPKSEILEDDRHIYHWHIEILPKLAQAAGFEWGTGFYINTMPPEQAAETLRKCG